MKKFICFIASLLFCFSCCATSKKDEAKTTMFVSEHGDRILLSQLANGEYLATLYIMYRSWEMEISDNAAYVANAYAKVEGNKISFTTTMLYNPKDFNFYRNKKEKHWEELFKDEFKTYAFRSGRGRHKGPTFYIKNGRIIKNNAIIFDLSGNVSDSYDVPIIINTPQEIVFEAVEDFKF